MQMKKVQLQLINTLKTNDYICCFFIRLSYKKVLEKLLLQ